MERSNPRFAVATWLTGIAAGPRAGYLFLSVLSRIASATGMFLWMRHSAPEDFGSFAYLNATAGLLGGVASFGLDMTLNVMVSRARSGGGDVALKIAAAALVGALGAVLVCLVTGSLWYFGWTKSILAAVAILVVALTQIVSACTNGICFAYGKDKRVAIVWLSSAVAFAILSYAMPGANGQMILSFYAASAAVPALIQISTLNRDLRHAGVSRESGMITFASVISEARAILAVGLKAVAISGLMLLVLWLLQSSIAAGPDGKVQLAVYALSTQIYNIVIFLPSAVGPLILSKMAASAATERTILVKKIALIFLCLSLSICAGAYFGTELVTRFLPLQYHVAPLVALIAAGAATIQFVKAPFSIYFQASLKMGYEVIATLMGVICVGVVVAMTIPLTAEGGALARLFAHAIQLLCILIFFGNALEATTKASASSVWAARNE